jgi:diguanylate cyclase (GGDEF)-like protein/PAS domain S-box-containing protein
MMQRNKGISMFTLIATFLVVVSFLGSALYLISNIRSTNKIINEKLDSELKLAVEIAGNVIADDYHARIKDETSISDTEYLSYVEIYNRICLENDLEYLWSVFKDENGVLRFSTGTSTDKTSNLGHAQYFEKHNNPQAFEKAFETGEPTYTVITDEWGSIKALLVPYVDGFGRSYIVGAAKSVASIQDIVADKVTLILIITALALFCSIAIALLFSKLITSPIDNLLHATDNIEKGDFGKTLPIKGTYEQREFTKSFNQMNVAIRAQLDSIKKLNQHLDITLESIGDGVITTDEFGKITRLNDEAQILTGWTYNEALGRDFDEVFHIENVKTKEKCENPIKQVLKTGKKVGLENNAVLVSKDGTKRSIADSAAPIIDNNNDIKGSVLVFSDSTEEQKRVNQIIHISYHDMLTGVYNRHYFEKELDRLTSEENLPLSIIVGDVNGLKLTNDVFGHTVGDEILKVVAETLKMNVRDCDVLARWGGDEFVILLPNITEMACEIICERIENSSMESEKLPVTPTISLGHATANKLEEGYKTTLKSAEEMMYRSKLQENNSIRNSIIQSLEQTLDEKYFQTKQHAQKVKMLCKKLGDAAKLSKTEIDQLTLLARLHDIGKIAIPESIIMKESELTEDEWETIKKHPEIGYRIATSITSLAHIADGILSHHERWDGSGYPKGLKGEQIPKISRIVSIVDSYDVMMSDRPYKSAISQKQAIAELKRQAGTQFDPHIVKTFVTLLLDTGKSKKSSQPIKKTSKGERRQQNTKK